MSLSLLIKNGRLLDPVTGQETVGDLLICNGRISSPSSLLTHDSALSVLDATGLIIAPGLIDLHVHLREPGGEAAEDIETGSRAAARGGFTTIVAMPNTTPPHATPEVIRHVAQRGAEVGLTRVLPSGCITKERKGGELANLATLAAAGATIFTDDGGVVPNAALLEQALHETKRLGKVVMEHAEDHALEKAGVMHEGEFSKHWKLPGIPAEAEAKVVARDIVCAEATGGAIHIQHVSAAAAVALIRAGRARGVHVTGEVTPHHLALTDADVRPDNPGGYKMNPPLRSAADRAALIEGLCDGTLTCLATDHAPHTAENKARGFLRAPPGVVGLETAVGVTYTELVKKGRMNLLAWLRLWTTGPAAVLGLPPPSLAPGAVADLVLLNLNSEWTVNPAEFATKSRNTPFGSWKLFGRTAATVLGGKITWLADSKRLK
ncbi:MAG: dihydroorotase [Verrucomicrobia bacterium]|nr:MAG: dihydroorotase [Verrucomicrobiota bacterium]